ncbi:alpha/beta fold hydrolase [Streptomyces sp. NPDC057099]|uniref:alpha/beta fold hydrolase n=1 Tax=Streptomyces sp. NPDC057099 TaxID=3346019 RepID=UPI003636368F
MPIRSRRFGGRPPRTLATLALLVLTAGAVTACGDHDSATSRAGGAKQHMIDRGGHRLAFHVTPGHGPTVIAYDRAGLGKSGVVPGPWKVESAVRDLESGLRQLGVTENVTLVAHSQAGAIATYFARANPRMLCGAVLVDANFTDEEIARLVAFTRPQVDAAKKDPDKPRNRQLISTAESFVATSKAYHEVRWPDAVPATVVVSEKTPFDGSPEDARRWRDAAASFVQDGPRRTLVTAEGSSHDVPIDRPGLVLEEIESMVATRQQPQH